MTNYDKCERLVLATQDDLPGSINLSEFNSYFDESPVADASKTIQVIQFDKDYEYLDNKVYGFNSQLISPTPNS